MIALPFAAQLSAQSPGNPHVQLFDAPPPARASELIRALPAKGACPGAPGRMEVSAAQPAALYRKGDRPAHGLKDWVDYPNGQLCLVEAGR